MLSLSTKQRSCKTRDLSVSGTNRVPNARVDFVSLSFASSMDMHITMVVLELPPGEISLENTEKKNET